MTPSTAPLHSTPAAAATSADHVGYVLCSLDPPIPYHFPKTAADVETAGNIWDSKETVGDPKSRGTLRGHNTTVIAACAPMYDLDKAK